MNAKVYPFELLQKSMEMATASHHIISDNLANANTPGFHAKHVEFLGELRKQLQSKNPDLRRVVANAVETEGLPEQLNGNTVDVDQQITNLEKNALLHQTYAQLLSAKISMMRTAITGR